MRPSRVAPSPSAAPKIAPPGIYFLTERVVTQTESGVQALNPGDEVRLMYRHKDGTMLVTDGRYEFRVKPSSVSRVRAQTAPSISR